MRAALLISQNVRAPSTAVGALDSSAFVCDSSHSMNALQMSGASIRDDDLLFHGALPPSQQRGSAVPNLPSVNANEGVLNPSPPQLLGAQVSGSVDLLMDQSTPQSTSVSQLNSAEQRAAIAESRAAAAESRVRMLEAGLGRPELLPTDPLPSRLPGAQGDALSQSTSALHSTTAQFVAAQQQHEAQLGAERAGPP